MIKHVKKFLKLILKTFTSKSVFLTIKKIYFIVRNFKDIKKHLYTEDHPSSYLKFITPHQFNNRIKKKLVICCAFTGRYELLECAIRETFKSEYAEDIVWFLCGSTAADLKFVKKMSLQTKKVFGMLWKNFPLGDKWNACLKMAGLLFDANLYAITGSDDVLSSDLINYILVNYSADKERHTELSLYYTNHWFIWHCSDEKNINKDFYHCKINPEEYSTPLGAGRFYAKNFLERVNFNIFIEGKDKALDSFGYQQVLNMQGKVIDYSDVIKSNPLISIKGNWEQKNAFSKIKISQGIEVKRLPSEEAERVLSKIEKYRKREIGQSEVINA